MAITAAQVSVTATETALNTASADGLKLVIKNTHATDTLFLGPTGVSTSNGYGLANGATVTVETKPGDVLFGLRGAAANITAYVLRS